MCHDSVTESWHISHSYVDQTHMWTMTLSHMHTCGWVMAHIRHVFLHITHVSQKNWRHAYVDVSDMCHDSSTYAYRFCFFLNYSIHQRDETDFRKSETDFRKSVFGAWSGSDRHRHDQGTCRGLYPDHIRIYQTHPHGQVMAHIIMSVSVSWSCRCHPKPIHIDPPPWHIRLNPKPIHPFT